MARYVYCRRFAYFLIQRSFIMNVKNILVAVTLASVAGLSMAATTAPVEAKTAPAVAAPAAKVEAAPVAVKSAVQPSKSEKPVAEVSKTGAKAAEQKTGAATK